MNQAKKKEVFSIFISQILAISLSFVLVKYVFFQSESKVRPSFKDALYNTPKNIAQAVINTPNTIRDKIDQLRYLIPGKNLALPPPYLFPTPIAQSQTPTNGTIPAKPDHAPRDNQQPTIYYPQTTTYYPPPTINNRQPTTYYPQPTTDNRQPTTYNPPPTTAPTQPPPPTATSAPPTVTPVPPPPEEVMITNENEVFNLINNRRSRMGLATLSVNAQLVSASKSHSQDMSNNDFCGHTGSNGSRPPERAQRAGFSGRLYGETVACGYPTPLQVVDGWWSSPGHKAILTNSGIRIIGIGWKGSRVTAMVGY